MTLIWAPRAIADLRRVCGFVAVRDSDAADRIADQLIAAPKRLRDFSRIGRQLPAYAPREVRRLIVGNYELRYEIDGPIISVLRIWHEREHRAADAE